MAKDIYEIHKIFKKAGVSGNSYAEKHGIDFVSTLFTLLIIGFLIVYFYYKGQTNRFKYGVDSSGNSIWSKERCKPHILPISGNLVKEPGMTAYESTYKNFKECSKEGHRKGVMGFINPLYIISGGISSLFTIIVSITRSFKNMISMVTDYLLNLFKVSKRDLDNIQSEITRSLNYHVFNKIKESTKSLEYMYSYLFTQGAKQILKVTDSDLMATVFEYLFRAIMLIFGDAAADALQGTAIGMIVGGILALPTIIWPIGVMLIAWGSLKIQNELYPLERDLLRESIFVQNQFDVLNEQTMENGKKFPLIPPAFGASNEMDQAYCLFYGAPVREMSAAEKDKEIERKSRGNRFYEWNNKQMKVKFHRDRGNINSLHGVRRLNLDEIVDIEKKIITALVDQYIFFNKIKVRMEQKKDKLIKESEKAKETKSFKDKIGVWNIKGQKGSTIDQLDKGIKEMNKQLKVIADALPQWSKEGYQGLLGQNKAETLSKIPGNFSDYPARSTTTTGLGVSEEIYKYGDFETKDIYWPSNFYNIFGKDQLIAFEIGGSWNETKSFPNKRETPLDQSPGGDEGEYDGISKKWERKGWQTAYQNYNRIVNTINDLNSFGANADGGGDIDTFSSFSNSLIIPLGKSSGKYEVAVLGTKPHGKDIGYSLWQNGDKDKKEYASPPELPWSGNLDGKNMTNDNDGMGNWNPQGEFSGLGWGGPTFDYQLCKTRNERFTHWRSGNFGASYGTKLKLQVMDVNSAKIESSRGPGSYAGGNIKFDMIKWEIDLHRLPKFDDFHDGGEFFNKKGGLDVHYLYKEHLDIITKGIRSLSISKWESIRDNGGLGLKPKDKYTKTDAWGNTVWMFGNEPPGIYLNSWTLRTDSMIRDYPKINWWSITDGTGKSNDSDVTNKFWFKDFGYTDAGAGWFGTGHNNHYMWDNQGGSDGAAGKDTIKGGIYKDTFFWHQDEAKKDDGKRYNWLSKYFIDEKVESEWGDDGTPKAGNLFNDKGATEYIKNDLTVNEIPRGANYVKYTLSQLSGRDKNENSEMSSGNGDLGGIGILKKSNLWRWPFLASVTDVNPLRETYHMPNFTLYANVTATCFGKNTKIPLVNNKIVNIQDLKLGDILEDGSKITALTKANVDDGGYGIIHLYEINNIIVSGKHKIEMSDGKLINAIDHPHAKEHLDYKYKYIYCFNNDSKRIRLNGINFCDWDEVSREEINFLNSFKNNETIGIDTPTKINKSNKICPIIHDKLESGFHPNTEIKLITGCLVPIKKIKIGDKLIDDSFVKAIIKVKIDDIDIYKHNIYGRTFYGTNNLIYTTECKYSKDGLTTTSTYFQHDREYKEKWIPKHKQECFYSLITNTGYVPINDVQFSHYNQNLEKFLPDNLYFE